MESVKLIFKLFSYTILGVATLLTPQIPFFNLPRYYKEEVGAQEYIMNTFIILVVVFVFSLLLLKIKRIKINILFWYFYILLNIIWWPFSIYGIWYSTSQPSFVGIVTIPIGIILAVINIFIIKLLFVSIRNEKKKTQSWHQLIKIPITISIITLVIGGMIIQHKQSDKKERPWRYQSEQNLNIP